MFSRLPVVAGIQAAKRTGADPCCATRYRWVKVGDSAAGRFCLQPACVLESLCCPTGKTGVEMGAANRGVLVAVLTIYDM